MPNRTLSRLAAMLLFSVPVCAQVFNGPGYVGPGPVHRVRLEAGDSALEALRAAEAIVREDDYGAFRHLALDETKLGGREGLLALGLELRDQETIIGFNDSAFDTYDTASVRAAYERMPAYLKVHEDEVGRNGEASLWVVQFRGPLKDEWLKRMEDAGGRLVQYVPSNSYVVSVNAGDRYAFEVFRRDAVVQWSGVYQPFWKLSPELRATGFGGGGVFVKTIIQAVLDGAPELESALTSAGLVAYAESEDVLVYRNIHYLVPLELLPTLATLPSVFCIEPLPDRRRLDEAQNQIMAGNLNVAGTQPSGPGYLAWLTGKGFSSTGQFAFAVDITDDGVDRGSVTDVNDEFRVLGILANASRVVYNNNYTSDALADGGDGHGNINASIACGYNDLAGAAYVDANGYHYGLGVAPFAQIGNTKVFDNAGNADFTSGTSTRLSAAYAGGARVSSNSWGTSSANYTTDAQTHDTRTRDAQSGTAGNQELSIVFAAGNDGGAAGSIGSPATAKNIIAVGASENYRQNGTDGCGYGNTSANNAQDLISFSSRGPCADGRVKPDIVAPGVHIQGAASRSLVYDGGGVCDQYEPAAQTLYAQSTGTSHSCPAVAGACALVRQYFINQALPTPSPAMVKAALMVSASHITGTNANDTLPSDNQGMGLVNLGRTFDGAVNQYVDQTQILGATGNTYQITGGVANVAKPFRVALVWTDAAGATTGNAWVNDLDLTVVIGANTYRGNVFTGAASTTGGSADTQNNAEFVFLPTGTTGTYTITVTAANIAGNGVPGNADTTDQDFALYVYNGSSCAAPVIVTQPVATSACTGSLTSFSVAATGAASYQWRKNTVNVLGATSAIYTIPSTVAGDAGSYDCVLTAACGATTTSNAATLTINTSPMITVPPAAQAACTGGSATFSVTATGGSLNYQWRKNTVNVMGATSSSLVLSGVVAGDAGSYDCVVSNACGSVTSAAAALTISVAVGISTQPVGLTVCSGAAANFSVVATGSPTITYQWRKGVTPIAGATSATYSIPVTTISSSGTYSVVVTNACGSMTSGNAVLTVNSPAGIFVQPAGSTICSGNLASFNVIATGTGPLTYQWRKNGANIGGATFATYTIIGATPTNSGTYDVVITNSCGSITSNGAVLTVNAVPTVTVPPLGQASCLGQPAVFSVTATGSATFSYQWRKNTVNIGGAVAATYTIAAVAAGDAANYDCVVTNTCGTATSASAALTVSVPPSITSSPLSATICTGLPFSVSVAATGTATLGYQWRKNTVNIGGATSPSFTIPAVAAADAANYDCVVTNICGSATSAAATLSVSVAPSITSSPTGGTVCAGQPFNFTVAATGTTPLGYQWRKDTVDIGGATGTSYFIAAATGADSGAYDCVVTNACGSATSTAAIFTAQTAPTLVAVAPGLIAPMAPNAAPIQLTLTGTCFQASALVVANGVALATTFVSPTTLLADLPPTIPQTQVIGGIAINVQNGVNDDSNGKALIVGAGSNQGIIRRRPLIPNPGDFFQVVMEGGTPFAPMTALLDFGVGTPVYPFLDPVQDLVLAVSPLTGSAGPMLPLFDGMGLFLPTDGSAYDATGTFTTPLLFMPIPSAGLTFTVQGIYLDLAAPNGFRMTWARYPDSI